MAKRDMPTKDVKPEVVYSPSEESQDPIMLVIGNCGILNLREKPDKNSPVLAKLPAGTTVRVDEVLDEWLHVESFGNKLMKSKDSKPGYILAIYTTEE